jgi:glutamine amidotransferase
MVTIINYGLGNLGSVRNMLKRIGERSIITSDPIEITRSEKLILPGVGAFDAAMIKIRELKLHEAILEKVLVKKTPILGICLGMQLLMEGSEEGSLPGLGLIKGKCYHFKRFITNGLKIPHMGWNEVMISKDGTLTRGFENEIRFYFVHSFFVRVSLEEDSMMKCNYGICFDAGIEHDNIFGAQFHPEKSHKYGMNFLKNFVSL